MKNYLRLSLTAIAFVLFFNAAAVTETKAQTGILGEILKRMEAHRQALTSLQANVTRDIYNSQLDEHDMSEGTTMYLPAKGRDALIRIDWQKPVQDIFSVVNKQYVLYQPRLKQAITGKADGNKNAKASGALSFMSMSKEQLKANYEVSYLGKEIVGGNVETWHLKLVPKTANSYKYAEVWVDGNGMPIQAKVIEMNDDSTTILLSNLNKNSNIDAKKFKISLPKDTKIIKG